MLLFSKLADIFCLYPDPATSYNFGFLLQVIDRENQMDNPCTGWLSDIAWDNITELDKLTNFHGIITAFEQYPRDWNVWYTSAEPETAPLPGEWDNACNELQRMLIVRSLRPDRVAFCATSFIVNNLGSKFTEPPVLDMHQVIASPASLTIWMFVILIFICFNLPSRLWRTQPPELL